MAFGQINQDAQAPMAEINVTPLVDVMLVLLIVFMVTMPVLTHSIPLQLPTASTQRQKEVADPLRLQISQAGEFYLGEHKQTAAQLRLALQAAVRARPDTVLAIAADKNVPYAHVAEALSAAQQAGLSKVGFVTETPPAP